MRARRIKRGGDDWISVCVADTGHGVPASMKRNIFTPFFPTTKDVGTGLGLWVTRSMIEKHGGTIAFRSTEGCGAVFRVVLPTHLPTDDDQLRAA